ncbi:MAG: alpha/beta fold hydrolase [Rhodocyclales bacterium]|nr:alpha/beta fold hydrolase [Rhodocyclales bacterium]
MAKACATRRGNPRVSRAAGLLLAALAFRPACAAPCAAPDQVTRVTGGAECLIARTYGKAGGPPPRTLYVLLHGNHTSGSPATSQYRVAEALAAQGAPGAVAVALIRPGYNDDTGNSSSGNAAGRADNFTAANIDIVADAVARLKDFHKADRLVLLGHSGGAAMAAVMLGRHAGLADAAVLVACPCNVPAWRAMSGRSGTPWTSESAIDWVARIPAQARVAVMVGERDAVTPPALSREYAKALRQRGIAAELAVLEGIDHVSVIGSPQVVREALRLGQGE